MGSTWNRPPRRTSPAVVSAGVVFTNFQPDGVDDFMQNTSLPSYPNALTTFIAGQPAPILGVSNAIVYQSGGAKAQIYVNGGAEQETIVGGGSMLLADTGQVDTGRSWVTDLTQGGYDNQNNNRTSQSSVNTATYTNAYDATAFSAGDLTLFAGPLGHLEPEHGASACLRWLQRRAHERHSRQHQRDYRGLPVDGRRRAGQVRERHVAVLWDHSTPELLHGQPAEGSTRQRQHDA